MNISKDKKQEKINNFKYLKNTIRIRLLNFDKNSTKQKTLDENSQKV